MKHILSLLLLAILTSCTNINDTNGDVSAALSLSDTINEETTCPLELTLNTSATTKALVETTQIPYNTSVGITVAAQSDNGRYSEYKNVKYTAGLAINNIRQWTTKTPVMLVRENGVLFSYYPYSDEVHHDYRSMPDIVVRASSTEQTDYMWGTPVIVNNKNHVASITMQHALSAVRIFCKRGSYTGTGQITTVTFGGDCAATEGILSLLDGTITDISGQGAIITPKILSTKLDKSYKKISDILVVPTTGTNGMVTVILDGTSYPIKFSNLNLNPGEITCFYLTANEGELSVADVIVKQWSYCEPESGEIVMGIE